MLEKRCLDFGSFDLKGNPTTCLRIKLCKYNFFYLIYLGVINHGFCSTNISFHK